MANFNGFVELVNVILDDYGNDERNSSKVKSKVLQKMEALCLKGLQKKCIDPKVKMDDLLAKMREIMLAPTIGVKQLGQHPT